MTTIRFTLVAPFLFTIISFAAFQSAQTLWDLTALLAIGLLGIFLRRFEWSRPAFLIGFVLSSQAESFANQAVQIATLRFRRGFWDGMEYVASPIAIVILLLTIVSIWVGIRQGKQILGNARPPVAGRMAPLAFLLAVMAYTVVAVWDASQIDVLRDKIFPITVGTVTLIACAILILRSARAPADDPIFADLEAGDEDGAAPHGLWRTLGWFALLLGLASLLGFILALAIFFVLFLRIRAGCGWPRTAILTAAAVGLMMLLGGVLGRDFPPGLLQSYLDLPWPFT